MLDASVRKLIDPPLNDLGRICAARGLNADFVTLIGLVIGLVSAIAIAQGAFLLGLVLIILSRFADGLDGAIARATKPSDFGGYLDITSDFLFYGAIPLAFVWFDPSQNGIAGAFLLTSFYFNGASFLGYAILAEKHGMKTDHQGIKSLYFSQGLLEGTETILFFMALCLVPSAFVWLAFGFGALCFVTGGLRLFGARKVFSDLKVDK